MAPLRLPPGQLRKLLVTGSRSWIDPQAIYDRLRELAEIHGQFEVIHGGGRGVDQMAATAARKLGLPLREFPADWRGKGKRAGIVRNLTMHDEGPNAVLAFWDGRSTGTLHCFSEGAKRGVQVEVITPRL